jgi:8-oxo-dGTP pyrophosphatase MutT (NUDIX family)
LSYLERIEEANTGHSRPFHALQIAGQQVGRVDPKSIALLTEFKDVFVFAHDELRLVPELDSVASDCEQRTSAVAGVLEALHRQGHFGGWRNERFAVRRSFTDAPLMLIERAALPLFGIRGWGVHVNGIVERDNRQFMWIGQRSSSKPTWPGQLDQMVAGGQPAGLGIFDNVIKECAEEAGICARLARRAIPTGAISYCYDSAAGLRPDVIFTFDLRLPKDFTPANQDGEVDDFYLLPLAEVAELARDTRKFKFNCSLVVIDFLLRHGFIRPDEPHYLELVKSLRMDPFSL